MPSESVAVQSREPSDDSFSARETFGHGPNLDSVASRAFEIHECSTVGEFKVAAIKILIVDNGRINWLIEQAKQKFKESTNGYTNMMRALKALQYYYQSGMRGEQYRCQVRRSLRRAGADPRLPLLPGRRARGFSDSYAS